MARNNETLGSYQIKITNILAEKEELQKKNEKLKHELALKEKEIQELKRESLVYSTDENKIKKVLDLKAQGHQYSVIFDKMKYSSFQINVNEIRNICLNIDTFSPELQLYYKKQVEAFEESIKINPELLKDTLTKRYEFLYNEASIDLVDVTEVEERRKIRLEMKEHLKEMNNVLKNIVEDNDVLFPEEEVDKSMSQLNKIQEQFNFSYTEEYVN
jgi:hypothetical protein